MDSSMGEALEASGGVVPEMAGVVQLLSDNAGLIVAAVTVALLLLMVLAEAFLAAQERRQAQRASADQPASR